MAKQTRRFYRARVFPVGLKPADLTPREEAIWKALEKVGDKGLNEEELRDETSLTHGMIQSAIDAMEKRGQIRKTGDRPSTR
jgi:DNA-binding MarR family transcriptional regulator